MAGITSDESGNRTVSMWCESGIQFRSNLIYPGGEIVLHSHSYDHVAMITHGWFLVTEITPEGKKEYQVASRGWKPLRTDLAYDPIGYRITIPAGHQHSFHLLESEGPGEVLCMWGEEWHSRRE